MSQSTVTEKRTVITSSSGGSGYDSIDDIPYKASFGSRSSNIMSRSSLPLRSSTGGTQVTRVVEYGYGSHLGGGMGPGGYSNVSNTGVTSVKSSREREKKDLQDLNERFASYIEKVRFLEAQNRKLGSELDELRSKWGKETSQIKQMYEAELAEARRLIDDLSKDKAALEIKTSSLQEQFGDMQRQLDEAKKYRQTDRETIAKLNQQLADCESEINMLRRTIESLETERARDKATINRQQQEIDKLRIDLNNETLAHLDAENRRQTLEEEMEFMKKVHEQELKELAALAYRDTTAENREFWKSELGQAIRDIQQEYDAKVEQLRGDMEGFYNLKIQEYRTGATKQNMEVTHIREENKKLTKQMSDLRSKLADLEARNAQLEKQYQDALRELESKETDHMMETTQLKEEIIKLRAEMEGILTELQTLMDAKLSLELEIAAYRKLLEGEENRVDWRSRASLIMYRDAFMPASDLTQPDSTRDKQPDKSEVIEAKADKTVSRLPDQREPSPDTDAASSITMSDNEMSQKGDEGDLELEDQSSGDKGLDTQGAGSRTVVDLDSSGVGTGDGSVESVKSPVHEHVVKVKEQVHKIETQKAAIDETDSKTNGHVNGTDSVVTNNETSTKMDLEIEKELKHHEKSPVQEIMESKTSSAIECEVESEPKHVEKSPVEEIIESKVSSFNESDMETEPKQSEKSPVEEKLEHKTSAVVESTMETEPNQSEESLVEENEEKLEPKSSAVVESAMETEPKQSEKSPVEEKLEPNTSSVVESEIKKELKLSEKSPVDELIHTKSINESEIKSDVDQSDWTETSKMLPKDDDEENTNTTETKQDKTIDQSETEGKLSTDLKVESTDSSAVEEESDKNKRLDLGKQNEAVVGVSPENISGSKAVVEQEVSPVRTLSSNRELNTVEKRDADEDNDVKDNRSEQETKTGNEILSTNDKTVESKSDKIESAVEQTFYDKIEKSMSESETVTKEFVTVDEKQLDTKANTMEQKQDSPINDASVPDAMDTASDPNKNKDINQTLANKNESEVSNTTGTKCETFGDSQNVISTTTVSETTKKEDVDLKATKSDQAENASDLKSKTKTESDNTSKTEDINLLINDATTEEQTVTVVSGENSEITSEQKSESIISKDTAVDVKEVSSNDTQRSNIGVLENKSNVVDEKEIENVQKAGDDKIESKDISMGRQNDNGNETEIDIVTNYNIQTSEISNADSVDDSTDDQKVSKLDDDTVSKVQQESDVKTIEKSDISENEGQMKIQTDANDLGSVIDSQTQERESKVGSSLSNEVEVHEKANLGVQHTALSSTSVTSELNVTSEKSETKYQSTKTETVEKDNSTTITKSEIATSQSESASTEVVAVKKVVLNKDEAQLELIEKTEDKILESVVQSQIIEKSQDSARLEMSPTKELPESFPEVQKDEDQHSSSNLGIEKTETSTDGSPVSDKHISATALPESLSSEPIEDDKTPEDEEPKATIITNSSDPSGVKEEKQDVSKIQETMIQSSTVDAQRVDSTSKSEVSVTESKHEVLMKSEEKHVESSSKSEVLVTDINTKQSSDKEVVVDQKCVDDSANDTINQTSLNKENDIMTQSFISENGLLTNGDIKDTDDKPALSEDTTITDDKTTAKDDGEKTKDQNADVIDVPDKPSEQVERHDTVLQEKIESLLLNGQDEYSTHQIPEPVEDKPAASKPDSQVSMKMMRGEVSAKTTYQRTSTGPIAISEVHPEAKFITLENTSSGPNRKDVNLDGWRLRRVVDGDKEYCYNFRNFTLKPGKKVKIMARGSAADAGLNDLVFRDENSWGVGQQVNTCLINEKNEEKASHIQRTNYN